MAGSGPTTYPVATIAKLLRLTERRVQQLSKEGVIPKAERGRYDLVTAVQGYIGYLQERAAGAGDGDNAINYAAEKARRMRAEADLKEMAVLQLRGTLIDAEEAGAVAALLMSELKAKLLNNAPVRIAAAAKSSRSEAALKKIIKAELSDIMAGLSSTDLVALMGEPVEDGV
ncbi:terminase small subunit, Nu1 [Salipiger sp. IMCC34102]|uniref:terminase small subunit, Nu1 n=1 Tax=Salipiger sp. IMCC34102 TaxID=2510647 RepID=UPI00101BC208|nr:terminase small subunit, Nu1 [Salipiger sp. IMCC34102]RYH04119.1 terminase small subunit, Nu1 [Salipiger sp. IMCC34102]